MRAGPIQGGFVRPVAPLIIESIEVCEHCGGDGGWDEPAAWTPTWFKCRQCDGKGEYVTECKIAGEERIVEMLEAEQ